MENWIKFEGILNNIFYFKIKIIIIKHSYGFPRYQDLAIKQNITCSSIASAQNLREQRINKQ